MFDEDMIPGLEHEDGTADLPAVHQFARPDTTHKSRQNDSSESENDDVEYFRLRARLQSGLAKNNPSVQQQQQSFRNPNATIRTLPLDLHNADNNSNCNNKGPSNGSDSDIEVISTNVKKHRPNNYPASFQYASLSAPNSAQYYEKNDSNDIFRDLKQISQSNTIEHNLINLHNSHILQRNAAQNTIQPGNSNLSRNNNKISQNLPISASSTSSFQNSSAAFSSLMESGLKQQRGIVQQVNEAHAADQLVSPAYQLPCSTHNLSDLPQNAQTNESSQNSITFSTNSPYCGGMIVNDSNGAMVTDFQTKSSRLRNTTSSSSSSLSSSPTTTTTTTTTTATTFAPISRPIQPQFTTANIFALYHSQPTLAAQYIVHDTMSYLRFVRCPAVFPRLHMNAIHSATSTASNAEIANFISHHQQHHAPIPNPSNFSNLQNPNNIRPDEIVLSFTSLLVAKHIVENIRNFRHPLHNIYSAQRFNSIFPISLVGGFVAGNTNQPRITRVVNPDNPIILDDDDENDTTNENTENTSKSPIFDLLSPQQREKLALHDPFAPTTSVNPLNNRKYIAFEESPLEDRHLIFLYTGRLPTSFKTISPNSSVSGYYAAKNAKNNCNSNGNSNGSDDEGGASQYTDAILSHMLDIIRHDVEHSRTLRDMLRPLLLQDMSAEQLQSEHAQNTTKLSQRQSNESNKKYQRIMSTGMQLKNTLQNGQGSDGEVEIITNPTETSESESSESETAELRTQITFSVNDSSVNSEFNDQINDIKLRTDENMLDPFGIYNNNHDDDADLFDPDPIIPPPPKIDEKRKTQIPSLNEKNDHKGCLRIPPHSSNSEILAIVTKKLTCPLCLCRIKKGVGVSKCGHIACFSCLRRSVALTKLCPTCRTPITIKDITRLYG